MPTSRVRQITPSPESAIADWYAGADLVDSYAVTLPEGSPTDARVLAPRRGARRRLCLAAKERVLCGVTGHRSGSASRPDCAA